MLDPRGLFDFAENLPDLGRSGQLVLVHALEGFVDAGHASRLTKNHLLTEFTYHEVARFDIDQLFDYRGRRPEMIFATDHWESYTQPGLALHAVYDETGKPFLLLVGAEPDYQWERFVSAVELLIETFDVGLVIGLNSIPMNVPHTRPTTVIAHGKPAELIDGYTPWLSTVQVPASAGHLIEYRLAEAGMKSMGFAVNVPHYVANLEYPEAAVKLLECISGAASLELPTLALADAAVTVRANIDTQVNASEEIASVVHALEKQYDEITEGRASSLLADGARLPTADEIGEEFEQYLLRQPNPPSDPPE